MGEWVFLDHHTRGIPSKVLSEKFAKWIGDTWINSHVEPLKEMISNLFEAKGFHLGLASSIGVAHFDIFLHHYIHWIRQTGRSHILALDTEQRSIRGAIKRLEKFEVQGKFLPVNRDGQLTAARLREEIRPRSGLLTLSLADPLTGIIQPIEEILAVCKEFELQVHLDVSVALGKIPIDLSKLNVDFLSFDGGLIGYPGHLGAVFSKNIIDSLSIDAPYAYYATLADAARQATQWIDHFALETGQLRFQLEEGVVALGGELFFQESCRLSNVAVIAFQGIHGEDLVARLKQKGIIATTGSGALAKGLITSQVDRKLAHSAVSFALSSETSPDQIDRLLAILKEEIKRNNGSFIDQESAAAKQMRVCSATLDSQDGGCSLTLDLLVDEEDGVIADCRFLSFASPQLVMALDATIPLLLRKNYMQARRLSVSVIEKQLGEKEIPYLNLVLELIDLATDDCMDIPVEEVYLAPPQMENGERVVYPGWEELSNLQKKGVIEQVIERDIRPYVELDAGGVEVLKVEDNRVTIGYSGNCTSCFSATGATLDSIGSILRHKIYPDLMVVPDLTRLNVPLSS